MHGLRCLARVCDGRALCTAEEGQDEPGFCGLLEELGVVVTIPTFDIIVLQVSRAAHSIGADVVSIARQMTAVCKKRARCCLVLASCARNLSRSALRQLFDL